MKLFLTLLCCAVALAEGGASRHHGREHRATATLADPEGKSGVQGSVTLVQLGDGDVQVTGTVTGLSPGLHGFHVHQSPNISVNCVGAGGHFNPFNKHHGGPTDADRHVGDLGNIEAGQDGVSTFTIADGVIRLTGENSIVGRSIVVHSDVDDLGKGGFTDSLTTGHAGSRLACGIIV